MKIINTQCDLVDWVHAALGYEGNPTASGGVAQVLEGMDHPAWGTDWAEWLARQDVHKLEAANQFCPSCGNYLTYQGRVPDANSDDAWAVIAPGHKPDCAWVLTRAGRLRNS